MKLSYSGKTLLAEIIDPEIDRREFLKRTLKYTTAGTFFAISLKESVPQQAEAFECCYQNCYVECHSDCGRKTW